MEPKANGEKSVAQVAGNTTDNSRTCLTPIIRDMMMILYYSRTGFGPPEPDRKGDSRRTGRVNPAPRPLVRAMHAGRIGRGGQHVRWRAIPMPYGGGGDGGPNNTCPRCRAWCAGLAPSAAAAAAAIVWWGERRRRERGTIRNHLFSPGGDDNSPHSLRRPTPENAPAAAPHPSEFDAGAPRTSHRPAAHTFQPPSPSPSHVSRRRQKNALDFGTSFYPDWFFFWEIFDIVVSSGKPPSANSWAIRPMRRYIKHII